jgi:hypothetical protein
MRTREEAVRIDVGLTLLLLACTAVVFAGFFAIGHLTRSSASVPRAYGPQALPAVSVRAGIPYGLAPAPAISVPVAAVRSQPPAPSARTATPSVRESAPAPAVEAAPAPQSPAPPVRSVAPAPVQPAPAPAPVSKPRGGGSAVEGGSFDSSG